MRRLPGILLATGAIIIVVIALAISGLRLALPQLDRFRPQLVEKISSLSGIPLQVGYLRGSWETFGPTLEVRQLQAELPKLQWRVERLTLALDVWQSLLRWRWQFRDLTFYQLQLDLKTTLSNQAQGGNAVMPENLSDLMLHQFDHFNLRNSRITFLTPSGSRAELTIPQLTWLNSDSRHRAEGQISLSSFNGQHGVVQVRMDLHDNQGLLTDGMVYLQADNIDLKPWFSRWLRNNTGLENADFSLAAWLTIKGGMIFAGDLLLGEGAATWQVNNQPHRLDVKDLSIHAVREGSRWLFTLPTLNLQTDGESWPRGSISALWQPENRQMLGPDHPEELRIRAQDLQLERLGPLLPTFSLLTPDLLDRWADLQPHGRLDTLALDIPLRQPEKTRFQARWRDISWQQWRLLPGMTNFSGSLSGGIERGHLTLGLADSRLPYGDMFRAPLEIGSASGAVDWRYGADGWALWGHQLDVQAKSLWLNGDFHYQQPAEGAPWLKILAGIRLYDAAEAWRYFPEPLMGSKLVDYLSAALQGGRVDNATLVYAGDPHHFPYKQNDGQFQVYVPLRQATFQFDPEWPALGNFAIDLDFLNDGLWMQAPAVMLGRVNGSSVSAVIPEYEKEMLLVDASVMGKGRDVGAYFKQTPLDHSLGDTLDELQVDGNVSGRLHLAIPLNGKEVRARGEVALQRNSLTIAPLGSTLQNVSGRFRFDNGDLTSDTMSADWFGQPLNFSFSTREQPDSYRVDVGLNGNWQPAGIDGLPPKIAEQLAGSASWNSKVAIALSPNGAASYRVNVDADLKKVSSHLPAPLIKQASQALPLSVQAQGDLKGFTLSGSLGRQQYFNSQWLLRENHVALDRLVWQADSTKVPPLPEEPLAQLNIAALDGESWLGMLDTLNRQTAEARTRSAFSLPSRFELATDVLTLGGQEWRQLNLSLTPQLTGSRLKAKGREIDGTLEIPERGPWRADIAYLYYNPQWNRGAESPAENAVFGADASFSFRDWPSVLLRCASCWLMGQDMGRLQADVLVDRDTLTLRDGLIDLGGGRLSVEGRWQQSAAGERTALKGKASGDRIDETASHLGIASRIQESPYQLDFDMNWKGAPWKPQVATLNGKLNMYLGKGVIAEMGGGRAGRLLSLLSFDALMRRLQLDFRDTFNSGFYFDSIRASAVVNSGILQTDDLLIDGLAADVAIRGTVDLVQRRIDMEAVIAPEISATVGVATAFVINPVVGAAVFAATKVLAPLWNRISVIRYRISGSLDQPQVNETLRQPKEEKAP